MKCYNWIYHRKSCHFPLLKGKVLEIYMYKKNNKVVILISSSFDLKFRRRKRLTDTGWGNSLLSSYCERTKEIRKRVALARTKLLSTCFLFDPTPSLHEYIVVSIYSTFFNIFLFYHILGIYFLNYPKHVLWPHFSLWIILTLENSPTLSFVSNWLKRWR